MINKNKKIIFVISSKDFRDIEYFKPREILENNGIFVDVASDKLGIAEGADGGKVDVNILVKDIDETQYDGIIFVGGPGCLKHLDNENSYKIIRKFYTKNKLVAAICAAGSILAKAKILKNKKATCWTSESDISLRKILEKEGANFVQKNVVIDKNIITSPGPYAASDFGEAILNYFKNI